MIYRNVPAASLFLLLLTGLIAPFEAYGNLPNKDGLCLFPDEALLPEFRPPGWIEQFFEAQKQTTGLAHLLPLTVTLSRFRVDVKSIFLEDPRRKINLYREHITRFPFDGASYERMDELLLEMDDPNHCVLQWKQLAIDNPEIGVLAARKIAVAGRILQQSGKTNDALTAFEATVALDPDFFPYKLFLGSLHDCLDQEERAIPMYLSVLKARPHLPETGERVNRIFSDRNDIRGKIRFWKEVTVAQPEAWYPGLQYASAAMTAREWSQAEEEYRRLLLRVPDSPEVWLDSTRFFLQIKDFMQARTLAGEISRRFPDTVSLLCWKMIETAESFSVAQDHESARTILEIILELDADNALAYLHLGDLHFRDNNWESAIHAYKEAVRLAPDNGWYRHRLGSAQLAAGNREEALASYQSALSLIGEGQPELARTIRDELMRLQQETP